MHLIARILNLKNRYQSLREFECTLIDLSGEKIKLSGKTYKQESRIHTGYPVYLRIVPIVPFSVTRIFLSKDNKFLH